MEHSESTPEPRYSDLLRAVADLIDAHDLVECHVDGAHWITVHVHATEDDPKREAAKWRRALGGTWDKGDLNNVITMEQKGVDLPGRPKVTIFLDKASCVRNVVGHEDVVIPAVEAAPERIERREIVEWDCEPVLAEVVS